jgi:hypothetical protein
LVASASIIGEKNVEHCSRYSCCAARIAGASATATLSTIDLWQRLFTPSKACLQRIDVTRTQWEATAALSKYSVNNATFWSISAYGSARTLDVAAGAGAAKAGRVIARHQGSATSADLAGRVEGDAKGENPEYAKNEHNLRGDGDVFKTPLLGGRSQRDWARCAQPLAEFDTWLSVKF